jgi:hypothetical protein
MNQSFRAGFSGLRLAHVLPMIAAIAAAAILGVAAWNVFRHPSPVDFISFWAAGRMGAGAYDIAAHHALEATVVPFKGMQPFPYPPPFLFVLVPFSQLPFGAAFLAWAAATGAFYFAAVRRFDFPPIVATGIIGQASFLTTGLFAFGVRLVRERPVPAGVLFGCLIIKPQIGVLIPLALIASRRWSAFAAAAMTALGLCLLALVVFGPSAYAGFFAKLPLYASLAHSGKWQWTELASSYAFARALGFNDAGAILIQLIGAIAGATVTWRAWRHDWASAPAVVAAATVLVSPYLFTYDTILLALPFGFLLQRNSAASFAVWLLTLLPVLAFFGLYDGPNTAPLAAVLSIVVLAHREPRPVLHAAKPDSLST